MPRFLRALCFLSGINALYRLVSGMISAISPPDIDQAYIDSLFDRLNQFAIPIEGMPQEMEEYYLNLMLSLGNIGAASFLFYGIEVVGLILMFRLNRIGFLLYTASQLGLAFVPAIFGGFNRFGVTVLIATLVWNAIWIIMYATQLKHFPKR